MTAKQRDFASFLDGPALLRSAAEDDAGEQEASALRRQAPFVAGSVPFGLVEGGKVRVGEAGPGFFARAYHDDRVDGGSASETAERPPDTDPAAVALELDVARASAPRDLDRLRRAFAFRNHPDRVRPEWRECAEIRMRIANRIIDEAKRRAAAGAAD